MLRTLAAAFATSLALAGLCAAAEAADKPTLTVYAYQSFTGEYGPGPGLKRDFEASCGCTLAWVTAPDGGALFSRLKLEGASTEADVVVGLDNNLMGEAEASGLFAPHGIASGAGQLSIAWKDHSFVPFDLGYFAFVYDADKLKAPPTSLHQLFDDPHGPTVVIEDPRTSTPGLGLLAWVRDVYGDKAPEAWASIRPRVVTVTQSWDEAYGLFLKGEADMVLSYTTSPAYHIAQEHKTNYRAAAFREGHETEVEVAGITAASTHKELGRRFLAFLLSDRAQAQLPETQWMYPAHTPAAGLPPEFKDLVQPTSILMVPPDTMAAKRRAWIDEWLAAMAR